VTLLAKLSNCLYDAALGSFTSGSTISGQRQINATLRVPQLGQGCEGRHLIKVWSRKRANRLTITAMSG
jgi:hypothetical protein